MSPTPSSYLCRKPAGPLTQHGKEGVIAAVLDTALGCRVKRVTGYDTDHLGTTRDIPRAGMQLEGHARRRASVCSFPVCRSGSPARAHSGRDPFAGMFPWNVEFLIFIDDERGLEVVGVAQGKANSSHLLTTDWAAAEAFAKQAGFSPRTIWWYALRARTTRASTRGSPPG